MDVTVKREISESMDFQHDNRIFPTEVTAFNYSNSGNDYISDLTDDCGPSKKKQKLQVVLPVGFLDPLSPEERLSLYAREARLSLNAPEERLSLNTPESTVRTSNHNNNVTTLAIRDNDAGLGLQSCRQFWKAANCFDEESKSGVDSDPRYDAMDRVRVHPRFLHSNATSHKWALGAFAELLDNTLDEVCNGATYVQVDVLDNGKDAGSKMLLFQDNGGGMTPDKMRQCMSLGYSAKSKLANTIGQYGNGFKTSTMRLGADVIVFSRCLGKDGISPTQCIGMLSYTFLRKTGKEDIVVPMIDYEKREEDWRMMVRSSAVDWERNLETIMRWSPYLSEDDLLHQFDSIEDHGTRIIVYNLWEDDEGLLELDFDTDPHDIQMRGVNRDEKKIEMATQYPNSRHFLTYHHSLRSYAAILYLRLPTGFKILLRGKDVEHHNIINDMMNKEERTYRPTFPQNASAIVTLGFVKDARSHIDIQGFNVYHKNRLIKPFWRVWNAAGSDGRGVIGVLEADFVEPAHDKQGFERTSVLERLENRLIVFQKKYWSEKCHEIGYAKRRKTKSSVSPEPERVSSPSKDNSCTETASKRVSSPSKDISCTETASKRVSSPSKDISCTETALKRGKIPFSRAKAKSNERTLPAEDANDNEMATTSPKTPEESQQKSHPMHKLSNSITITSTSSQKKACMSGDGNVDPDSKTNMLAKLIDENRELKKRLNRSEGVMVNDLLQDLLKEKDKTKLLEKEVLRTQQKLKVQENEHMVLLNLLEQERNERAGEKANLEQRLTEASHNIEELHKKIKLLESGAVISCKSEH